MFKSMTMLAGGALGVYMAVATGAPSPQVLMSQLTGKVAGTSAAAAIGGPVSCSTGWGTGTQASSRPEGPSTARVNDVRVGQHTCFDRLVIDLGPGRAPGYRVQYVSALRAQGSGRVIPLRGRGTLQITVDDNAAARFPATAGQLASVSGFSAFRQVAGAGSFEGYTEIGLGVRGRLPFSVYLLNGPGRDHRLVVDVAHQR
jgi:hypothetical protein